VENKQRIFKFTVGVVIFILALILIHFKKGSDTLRTQISPVKMIKELPKFNTMDINDNPVRSKDFIGKNLYVQFVEPLDFDDIDLIKIVYSIWKDENLEIIAITKDLEKFKQKSKIDLGNIIVVNSDYERLKSKFNSPSNFGTYYLFNSLGKVVDAGKNNIGYQRGVKVHLKRLIKNEYFSISEFIKANDNIKNIEWFSQVTNIVKKVDKDYFVISLFTDICVECPSGRLLNKLKELDALKKNSFYFATILSDDFTEDDIKNLKEQIDIGFDVLKSDGKLSKKWRQMIEEFGEFNLTDIVFLLNEKGEIVQRAYPGCECYQDFFSYLDKIINR